MTLAPKLALAIDLDGTLLAGEDIPPENVRALRAARDAGWAVIIATARWRQMASRVAEAIGIEGLAIACSGAQVWDPRKGDILDERLPADFVAELYALCDAERCVATMPVSERVWVKADRPIDWSRVSPEVAQIERLSGSDGGLPRVALVQGTDAVNRIRTELAPRFGHAVQFYDSIGPSGRIILTMTSARADKGEAVRIACGELGLDLAQCVAFGDAENDVTMFRVAGRSVAMGQAVDAVKQAATHVTGTNREAGVAQAIDRLLRTGEL
ncbi:HAD-IIB family hydrolase [Zavarzinia sp. CC-PAN008]|uniref:HAD-IIB family hydrolase n=1 Tax=Zavarzinia sp. CC-PAN008 TaxID=3243332 RepID=UPI003F748227